MRGNQWLREPEQYALVFSEGRSWVNNRLVMKALPNGLNISRYGFSVSRRVGKAVVRNQMKRRLREIMRTTPLKTGWDIVFIARPSAVTSFANLRESAAGLLSRGNLLAAANTPPAFGSISGDSGRESRQGI